MRGSNFGALRARPCLLALGGLTVVNLQALQLQLDLGVALGQLRAHEVERAQRLLEREQVLGAPVALQALGDLIDAGAHTQDLLAALTDHVGQDVGELDVHHLGQSLLHVLH